MHDALFQKSAQKQGYECAFSKKAPKNKAMNTPFQNSAQKQGYEYISCDHNSLRRYR
jgi:hypothetical protein